MIHSKKAKASGQDTNQRFDIVALRLFPEISRKQIKKIIDSGGAYLNKQRVKLAKSVVRESDLVELYWEVHGYDEGEQDSVVKSAINCSAGSSVGGSVGASGRGVKISKPILTEDAILFEHRDYLVINKPAGIPSQATLVSSTDTILHALNSFDSQRFPLQELFLVHRLDKETSGVFLVARNKKSQGFFEELFRQKKIEKTYTALCYFTPRPESGIISFAIAKDTQRKNTYYALTQKQPFGTSTVAKRFDSKTAVTRYKVAEYFSRSGVSRVELFPETGRTHQIRVHLQAMNCPIVGDKTYAQNISGHPFGQPVLRHMLHAIKTSFTDTENKKQLIEAPLPADFSRLIELLAERER